MSRERLLRPFFNDMHKPMTHERLVDTLRMTLPILVYAVIYLTWFFWLEKAPRVHFTEIHTRIDDLIPFQEVFIIPYYIWFFYVSASVIYFLVKYEKEEYFRLLTFLITGMTVFLIVSTLFPNMQTLRPSTMPRDNVFTHLVARIYKADTPTNVWPSIHVYNSIGSFIGILCSRHFTKLTKWLSGIMSTLIILSTMFIKQHSVFDVVTGFIMAFVVYLVVYRTDLIHNMILRREAEEKLSY